jgi:hypothetical protein
MKGVPGLDAEDIPLPIVDDDIVQGMIAARRHAGEELFEDQVVWIVDQASQNAMIDRQFFVVDMLLSRDAMEVVDVGARTANGEELTDFRLGCRRAELQRRLSRPRAVAGRQGKAKSKSQGQEACHDPSHRRHRAEGDQFESPIS